VCIHRRRKRRKVVVDPTSSLLLYLINENSIHQVFMHIYTFMLMDKSLLRISKTSLGSSLYPRKIERYTTTQFSLDLLDPFLFKK